MREGIKFPVYVDKAINVAWFFYWAYRLWVAIPPILSNGVTLAGGIVILRFSLLGILFLIRSPGRATRNPRAWVVAAILTVLALFYDVGTPTSLRPPFGQMCVATMLLGLVWCVLGTLVLGRSFGAVAAYRGLKLHGPYRLMRHPIYAGYILHDTALVFLFASPHNFFLLLLFLILIQWQAKFEEEVLASHDPAYVDYCAKVSWRFIPGLF